MQLTQRINQTQLEEKDPDAQNLLGRELGANSDALYIMAQTLLVQNMALEQLKAQVAQLKQAPPQPAHATSFLGRLFGETDQPQGAAPQFSQPQYQAPPQQYQQPQGQGWQPVPNYQQAPQAPYGQPQYAQPQYVGVPAGQPSFLRGAMQTAAGVAAGALVFEGVESLMHGFGHGGGWGFGGPGMAGYDMGGGGFGGGFERPIEETVVNNYYDQQGPGGGEHHAGDASLNDQLDRDFGGEQHGHETAQFADAGDSSGANQDGGQFDQGSYDNGLDSVADNSADDVQIDDSGSGFDDGGGFDGGGGSDNSGGDGF
jgi:uncharacterized protein